MHELNLIAGWDNRVVFDAVPRATQQIQAHIHTTILILLYHRTDLSKMKSMKGFGGVNRMLGSVRRRGNGKFPLFRYALLILVPRDTTQNTRLTDSQQRHRIILPKPRSRPLKRMHLVALYVDTYLHAWQPADVRSLDRNYFASLEDQTIPYAHTP